MEKIHFNLNVVDDYPPVCCEQIDCEYIKNDEFLVKRIPMYSKEISIGDVILTELINDERVFVKTKNHCGNSTMRIIFYNDMIHEMDRVVNQLSEKGVIYEKYSEKFVALNIPKTVNIIKIFDYLDLLENEEILSYDTGYLAPSFNHQTDTLKQLGLIKD